MDVLGAAILARCSDNQDGDSGSVEGQVRRGRKAAADLGWNVAAVHDVDDGFSASRFATKARAGWPGCCSPPSGQATCAPTCRERTT
jgi:hypothetical protein